MQCQLRWKTRTFATCVPKNLIFVNLKICCSERWLFHFSFFAYQEWEDLACFSQPQLHHMQSLPLILTESKSWNLLVAEKTRTYNSKTRDKLKKNTKQKLIFLNQSHDFEKCSIKLSLGFLDVQKDSKQIIPQQLQSNAIRQHLF